MASVIHGSLTVKILSQVTSIAVLKNRGRENVISCKPIHIIHYLEYNSPP